MSKFNMNNPWPSAKSDEAVRQFKELEMVFNAQQNQIFYNPQFQTPKKHSDEPRLPPNFAELVQKQVTVLLFALNTNRSGLARKICERLAGTDFFSYECSYLGVIPRSEFEPIFEQLSTLYENLRAYRSVPDQELHKFLDLLSEKGFWGVTL
jgi:hypothetical protein